MKYVCKSIMKIQCKLMDDLIDVQVITSFLLIAARRSKKVSFQTTYLLISGSCMPVR